MEETKGNTLKLACFEKWNVGDVIGFKTIEAGCKIVNFIWCKICARNKNAILQHPNCKGSVTTAAMRFIDGTNYVSSHKVFRHIRNYKLAPSTVHEIALLMEKDKLSDECTVPQAPSSKRQTSIKVVIKAKVNDAYRRLINCAYEMAMTTTMPHVHFSLLVKCCKKNRVKLIKREENGKIGTEFVHCIAEAVKEKVAEILGSYYFMSILSDGSQARKTKKEKELVLIRTERSGLPVFIVASVVECSRYGAGDSESIFNRIKDVFSPTGINIAHEKYTNKVVSASADGASQPLPQGFLAYAERFR